MSEDKLYYYYGEKENEETSQEHLTRMLYLRNFDTPKKINELKDEIDVLRSAVETLRERAENKGMDSIRVTCKERK